MAKVTPDNGTYFFAFDFFQKLIGFGFFIKRFNRFKPRVDLLVSSHETPSLIKDKKTDKW